MIMFGKARLAAPAAAAVAVLALTGPASAAIAASSPAAAASAAYPAMHRLSLRAMPRGVVSFGRWHHRLTARVAMNGLTPGSSHAVRLVLSGRRHWAVSFSPLTANGTGQASGVLHSRFTGRLPRLARLVIFMGTSGSRVAREPIALTARLRHPGRPHRFIAIEVGPGGRYYGTPEGRAAVGYNPRRHTLTIVIHATGLTPGAHAAHVHLGSCKSQGPVLYMLGDLIADRHGTIRRAVRVITGVTKPIPAHGWYINIHQGNTKTIAKNGQPTIFFRPLLCRDLH
ncbi:MAG TPA: hypothetical protein VF843_18465 [Streptosporangiaceae bacterium]